MVSCPYEAKGCQKRMSPYESDGHVVSCEYRPKSTAGGISSPTPPCLFKSCGCTFKTTDPDKLAAHLQSDMATHLNVSNYPFQYSYISLVRSSISCSLFDCILFCSFLLPSQLLLASFNQKKAMAFKSIEAEKLWDAPSKSTDGQNGSSTDDHSNDALLSALYERIVVLEQMSREQGLKIDKLTTQLNRSVTSFSEMSARHSGGILLWQITNFTSKVEEMRNSASTMYYSPDVFTGPFGYRFCARISVSPKAMHSIALYLHMMRSENDYHLDWPFRGCLKFWMINNCDSNLTQHDKIMTNEKAMAFARPQMNISPRGFGFLEYAAISDIYGRGFLRNDTLTIKFHIGIV